MPNATCTCGACLQVCASPGYHAALQLFAGCGLHTLCSFHPPVALAHHCSSEQGNTAFTWSSTAARQALIS